MSSVMMMPGVQDAPEVAGALLHAFPDRRVFALRGELGAGKTTLIKALCAELGVEDTTSSPSFAIVNEYRSATAGPVYHFDLYRMKDAAELEGIGFHEYLDSGHYCFVEWPEIARGVLPPDTVRLHMYTGTSGRRIQIDITPLPRTRVPEPSVA